MRARSRNEIELRLEKAKYDTALRKSILESLEKDSIINDFEFAKEWIESRLRSNPRGKKLLVYELEGKGVSAEIIEQALEAKAEDLDERRIARDLLIVKLDNSLRGQDERLNAKLFQYLLRRGFETDMAMNVVNEVLEER